MGKLPGRAHLLTSKESLAIMLEKRQKKKEEEKAKERRKLVCVEKKLLREIEMKKAEECELKVIEKKRKAAEAEVERKKKQEEREIKANERQNISIEKQRAAKIKHKQKEQEKNKQKFTKVCYKEQESLCNPSQIDNILCMLCFRNYTDDLVESGTQTRDWIQCISCKRWMHEDCASKDEDKSNCVWCM